ncbi:PHB depolymerase family esterase [Plantactinospora solaniradicis]|uniref:PHB depolymerase family esterase n=1 Tax=Plantactinospora solaniradicis TaxID=1723736 RepID=A0ABW1KG93_9ACTN
MRHRPVLARLVRAALVPVLATVAVLAVAAPARAASLTQVTGFGSNPGNLTMYAYRPDGLPSGAPAVVLLHGCAQNANGYFGNSGWRKYADQWGFALIVPEQKSANNSTSCFNWFEPGDTARGQGEALSIKQMVDHARTTFGTAANRVYVSGLSAGGAMASAMLASYPDTFAAGSIVAGIPYRCATSMVNAFSCMNPGVDRTPAQWGDLVRNAYPGYTGQRPKVAIWHGTGDYTVGVANAAESRDQWTNVLGVSQTPSGTSSLPGGTTLETYGADQVRLYRVAGMGHGTPVDPGSGAEQCGTAAAYFLDTICSAYRDAIFFGLGTGVEPEDPGEEPGDPGEDPVCVTATNYAHVQAGRAYQSGGYAYAVGSGARMGLYNVFASTTLRQTGPGHWVIGC